MHFSTLLRTNLKDLKQPWSKEKCKKMNVI